MATDDKNLRKHLGELISSKHAHVDFDSAVKGIPARLRGVQPEGLPYSAWQLLEHLRLAQEDILNFCVNPKYRAPKWPDDYWPRSPKPPTTKSWLQSAAAYRADRKRFERLVADSAVDLYGKIPHGEGQTYLREILLVADHTAFHLGELVVVRRLLGCWTS